MDDKARFKMYKERREREKKIPKISLSYTIIEKSIVSCSDRTEIFWKNLEMIKKPVKKRYIRNIKYKATIQMPCKDFRK